MDNKSDIRNVLKDAGILFVITLIAGLMLGFVYELTKEPIRLQQEKAVKEACQAVFGEADQFVAVDYSIEEELKAELAATGVTVGDAYFAMDNGEHLGFVVEATSSEGYGGAITLYMGITNDGTLKGISILDISETPGLGMKAEEVLVPQFKNKQVEAFTYTKAGSLRESEIDAISGATVTTEAVTYAVNGGLKVFAQELKGLDCNAAVSGEGGNSNE